MPDTKESLQQLRQMLAHHLDDVRSLFRDMTTPLPEQAEAVRRAAVGKTDTPLADAADTLAELARLREPSGKDVMEIATTLIGKMAEDRVLGFGFDFPALEQRFARAIEAARAETEADNALRKEIDRLDAKLTEAERNSTDRDQINYDEGRRFERAAIIAMLLAVPPGLLDKIEGAISESDEGPGFTMEALAALRALAEHLERQPEDAP